MIAHLKAETTTSAFSFIVLMLYECIQIVRDRLIHYK